jgi:hypothetical protein
MKRFIPIMSIAFGGCFFGTFQTAEPVKQGEMDAGLYLNFSSDPRAKTTTYGGGFLGFGVTDNLSLGLGAGGTGIGPYAKWTAYRHPNYYLYFSLVPRIYLDVFSSPTTAFPQMDFIFGARANRFFSWYVFYQVLYSQREMKVYEGDTFRIPGRIKDLPLYHYAGLGFDITTVFRGLNQKTPYGFRIEIGGSYFRHNGRYEPVISFGFALTNASALWLIDMTFNYVCLPMLAIALSSMLDNNQSKSASAQQPTSGEQKPPKDTTGKGRRVEKGKENKEVIIRIDEMEKKGEELKEDSTKVENKQPAVQDTVKKDTVKKDTTVKVPKKPKVIRKGITKKPQTLPKKDTGKGIREEKPSETR